MPEPHDELYIADDLSARHASDVEPYTDDDELSFDHWAQMRDAEFYAGWPEEQ